MHTHCPDCGIEYIPGRYPRCGCRMCGEYDFDRCIRCCAVSNPTYRHTIIMISTETFLCRSCLGILSIIQRCSCCRRSFNCGGCCNHSCCQLRTTVQFVQRPLRFAYPLKKGNIGWTNRDTSEAILTRTASMKMYSIDLKGFQTNTSRRFAAVELEYLDYESAACLNLTLEKWGCSVVEDNSMRRNYNATHPNDYRELKAFEINTSPACGDTLPKQLNNIIEAVNVSKAEISLSCGVHVHVDCRDFGYQELQKVIRVYSLIEETLFAAVHWSRYNNEFCQHCGQIFHDKFIKGIKPDTKGLKASLISGVYGVNATNEDHAKRHGRPQYHDIRHDHYGRYTGDRNQMRYSALNLHSYFLRGTVESRIHHASTSFTEIYGWAKLLVDLFDAIGRTSEQKLIPILTVKRSELLGALELLDVNKFKRNDLDIYAVATGIVVLRSLLPDASFKVLLQKIDIACKNLKVSTTDLLPCQFKNEGD